MHDEEDQILDEILLEQDNAAVKIQTQLRRHLAVREVKQLKEEIRH